MDEEPRDERINIRLSATEKASLERAAEQMNMDVSTWVRHFIEIWEQSFSLVGEDERNR